MTVHPHELLSAYADGELTGDDAHRVAEHLATCTECARELALIRSLGAAMIMEAQRKGTGGGDLWPGVHRRLTQPVGWILVVAGVAVWAALALVEWFRTDSVTIEWLATTAIGIGVALLVVAIGHQQFREWRESPYKDLHK